MIDQGVFNNRQDTIRLRAFVNQLVVAPEIEEVDELLCEIMEEAGYLLDVIRGEGK